MPTHFTVEQLASTRRAASTESGVRPTEFLWIDIACIDQRPTSKKNASEVGRQGKIFKKKAGTVYIWLQSFDTISLGVWLQYSIEHLLTPYLHTSRTSLARGRVLTGPAIPEELLGDIERHIQRLAQDPWCTSLWTLQEEFLRPDAFIRTRSPPGPERVLPDLPHALDWLSHIIADSQRSGLAHNNPRLGTIQRKALVLGFVSVVHGSVAGDHADPSLVGSAENPFHLLACSAARQTSREEDRVYGIMQGSELRLGKSAVGETRTDFSVQELEHQLEEALLAKYPMASQLVIQPKDCTLGKAWLVQSGGVVSTPGEVFWIALQDRNYTVKSLIKLSVGQCNGQRWGFFEGPLASFSSLAKHFDIGVLLDRR
jgi:hypothetical protein